MKKLTQGATRLLVLALGLGLTATGWADFAKTNPVTGATENYTWKFVGTDTWNGTGYWQNSDGNNPTGVPGKSGEGNFEPFFFDGSTVSINAGMSVEGWDLRMGLFNGATLTMNNLQKFQDGTMWVTVDESSKLTITANKNDKYEGDALNLYSAREAGIEWSCALSNAGGTGLPFNYYLAGHGTVAFTTITAANCSHTIKRADVTLSEVASSKTVRSKTLVSFTSSTSTFLADATIKVKNADCTANRDVALSSVTATTSTLTESSNVGDCELVQTSTGVVLYYVDYAKTYKNSININFTDSGSGLTTSADVGLGDYAIPGTSWNNLAGSNGSLSALNAADSSGATFATAASVAITEARGSYSCSSLTAASDLRHGYIDESTSGLTPTITVSGIPYEKYRVIVYTATDAASKTFGYLTINGKNYTYVNSALTEGTTAWGDSGGQNTAEPMSEGVNVLVSPVTLGSTLTVVGHRNGNDTRGCIAAVQIVEYVPEVTENDLVIPLMQASTTYTVSEAKTLSGTVYVVGNGTLTLDGSAKITASTIDVAKDVVLNINADRLDATTFTGSGTVVYDGSQPSTTKGFDNSSDWAGTVWVKNIGDTSRGEATNSKVNTCLGSNTAVASDNDLNKWGNANSFVKFTNVRAYMAAANVPWTLILEDDSTNYAWYNNEGWTARTITIAGLKGSGTFWDINDSGCRPFLNFTDASQFSGSIKALGKQVFLNGAGSGDASSLSGGRIVVPANQVFTVAADKTWHTRNGLVVDGILNVNGTLGCESSSSAVSGSGTVVFDGKTPSPTGNAWWKNAAWTGTVEVKNHTLPDNWLLSDYGNTGSKVRLDGVSGPIKYGTDSTTHNIKELIIASGGYTHTGTYSSGTVSFTVPCKITGSGTYKMQSGGAAQKTTYFTGDMSEFGGTLEFGDDYSRFVIGSTETSFTAKSIVVGDGAVAKISYPSEWYPAGGVVIDEGGVLDVATGEGYIDTSAGIVVNGTVKAKSLRRIWGGIAASTPITINSTGVLELTSAENTNDSSSGTNPTSLDLSKVTGTGTIKYSSTAGWRAFPDQDAKMPASTVGIQVELADSLIISKYNGETVIGSLSGSKNIRSDFNNNGANGRILTVTQSKDTEWQGKFVSNRITQFNVVTPAEGTPGTLTLSGTQTENIPAQIDGSVKLTGTWKGATTVAGTFGGTGTLAGNLTFSDGATFKANATALTVSGTVTTPGSGSVAVDVSDIASSITSSGVTLISGGVSEVGTFAAPSGYRLAADNNALNIYPVVTVTIPEVANATAAVTVDGVAATGSSPYTADVGSDVEITWTAASGYKITGGATQTINDIAANTTADTPTVEAMGATVSDVNFAYGADYATATVTATVSGDATAYTLTVGQNSYDGVVSGSTVTFSNVATGHASAYDSVSYTITAKDGETAVPVTSGGDGTAIVADVTAAGWINENATTTGTSAGGSWTNAVNYTDGKAEISDNRFEATTASTASRVVLEFNVCFSATNDADVDGTAQAAIKLGEVESAATFMVLEPNSTWTPVFNADITPDPAEPYKVVLTIDYGTGSYGVTVGDNVLTNASGSASFQLAASKTSVQNIDFAGSGTLTSMKGDQVEGYMVKDNAGNWYATIQDATQAYNSANGPYTVLHIGTVPSGWKIDGNTLIKLAKGFFFMAY